jgi:hypothetical protein
MQNSAATAGGDDEEKMKNEVVTEETAEEKGEISLASIQAETKHLEEVWMRLIKNDGHLRDQKQGKSWLGKFGS